MPLRREPEPVSPRALARVRSAAGERAAGGTSRPEPGADGERGRHRPIEVARGPVLELPTSLRGARWAPPRSAGLAVLVLALLVAVVFGARVWLAGSGGESVHRSDASAASPSGVSRGTATLSRASPGSTGGGSHASTSGSTTAASAPAGSGGAAGVVVVHVVGQVVSAGVYRLSPGARIADAVQAAGGATRAADLSAVNLARVVVDGEQVVVPRPGEAAPPGGPNAGAAGGPAGAGGTAGGGAGAAAGTRAKVALNSADLAALDTLPGVGPVLAQRILDWRTEHGRFTSVEELGEVSGIGDKLLSQLTPKVTL